MPDGKKKYTLIYRIYRRLRYLSYVLKLKKQQRKADSLKEKEERRVRRQKTRQQRINDRISDKEKKIQEKKNQLSLMEQIRSEQETDLAENAEKYARIKLEEKAYYDKERKFRNRKRRKLIRFYTRVCWRETIRSILLFNPANIPSLLRKIKENKKLLFEFLIISLHSSLLFVAAYLLIFLIGLLTSSIAGVFFDYKSIVFFNEVLWLVKPDQWFGDSVKMVYSSPPIIAGIIAVIFAILFSYVRTDRGLAKLFILWTFMHGFNAFFGSLLIGSIFGRGFGYAIIWAYISDTEKVIYSIISLTALFLIGVFTTRSFLISANTYYSHLESRKQRYFIWAQVITPFLLGNLIIGMIMMPKILVYDMTVSLALLISIIPIAIGYRFYPSMYFEEDKVKIKPKAKTILYAIFFILLYRIVLGIGIPIG